MFSKPLIAAALLGSASAFDLNGVTRTDTMECGACVLSGNNFCTLKSHMTYYSKLTAAYTRTAGVHAGCCAPGTTACSQNSKTINNDALYSCFNLPTATTTSNAYSFTSKSLELAACPFDETYCGTTREFTYTEVGKTGTVSLTAMDKGQTCTYVVKASAGAPNFELDSTSTVREYDVQIAFLEFDASQVTTYAAAVTGGGQTGFPANTFPAKTQAVSFLECTACVQGDLVKRSKVVSSKTVDVSASGILTAFAGQKEKYTEYEKDCTNVKEWNAKVRDPNFWESLLGVELLEAKEVPKLPAAYSGDDFSNTDSQGGYGAPTAGYYDVSKKGFKPYGAEGQGASNDKNIALSTAAADRFMFVQVIPLANYTQATKSEVMKLNFGSYNWDTTTSLTAPTAPSECKAPTAGSNAMSLTGIAASFATLAALTLY